MNNNCPKGNFLNGFLWGLIIGGGAVFLLKSKKGKKLVKTIIEEGLELSEFIEEEVEDFNSNQMMDQKTEKKENKDSNKENLTDSIKKNVVEKFTNGEALTKITNSGRRFFKGIHRRS